MVETLHADIEIPEDWVNDVLADDHDLYAKLTHNLVIPATHLRELIRIQNRACVRGRS